MNAQEPKIPYPWLVFNEKMKVNAVFLRDSTAVSDSVLLLFGGDISRGLQVKSKIFYLFPCLRLQKSVVSNLLLAFLQDGHLQMMGGYLEFFMKPALADIYVSVKRELEELIHCKVTSPDFSVG